MQGFTDGDGPGNLFLGQRTGDGDLMRRRFRVGCGCFFLGGRGRGRGVPGRVLLRSFRRTAGSKQPCVCIYYMLSSGGFAAACLQAIAKGVSSILGRPGQTRAMFQASTTRRPVHTLTTVEGLLLLVPPGLHGVVGMMFMHMRSMLLYVICLLHVYVCYMSLALELDMLFVVICCMSVICYMLLFVVICYMSVICYMPVICLVLGGVVRVRLYVIYCAFV